MGYRSQVCPVCGQQIQWLRCAVTKGVVERWSLPEPVAHAPFEEPEKEERSVLWEEFDHFECPLCVATICETDDEAIRFLKTGKLPSHC